MKAVQTDSYGWNWRETNYYFLFVMSSKRQVTWYKLTFAVCRIQGDSKSYFIWMAGADSSTFYFREGHHPLFPQDRYPIPHEGGVSNLFCYKLLEDSLSHPYRAAPFPFHVNFFSVKHKSISEYNILISFTDDTKNTWPHLFQSLKTLSTG